MSKNAFTITSMIKNGRMNDTCRLLIVDVLKGFEGKFAKITIEERKNKRSLSQNAFYWGVMIPLIVSMFNEYGNNVNSEGVHEFLKSEVGKLESIIVMPNGEVKCIRGSSAALKTAGFEEYLTKIRAWAAEFGLILPMPNEELL